MGETRSIVGQVEGAVLSIQRNVQPYESASSCTLDLSVAMAHGAIFSITHPTPKHRHTEMHAHTHSNTQAIRHPGFMLPANSHTLPDTKKVIETDMETKKRSETARQR